MNLSTELISGMTDFDVISLNCSFSTGTNKGGKIPECRDVSSISNSLLYLV